MLKKRLSSRCFLKSLKSFIIVVTNWSIVVCEGGLSGLMTIQRTATFLIYGIKPSFNDTVKARAKSV